LIIAGASAFSREFDYARFRQICDKHNAILMADMAHISGLVAAGVLKNNPFDHCQIVTTTTHKTLRGPRGGMIFYRKGKWVENGAEIVYDYEDKINWSVFPALQGGPHQHQIAAISVALHEASSPDFITYQKQVKQNAKVFADEMSKLGYKIQSGGTETHLFLMNVAVKGVDGARAEMVLEHIDISVNKNTLPGDTKPLVPSGLRIGTPALTTRGFNEQDIIKVAHFLDRGIKIAKHILDLNPNAQSSLIAYRKEFEAFCKKDDAGEIDDDLSVKKIRSEIQSFANKFPMP